LGEIVVKIDMYLNLPAFYMQLLLPISLCQIILALNVKLIKAVGKIDTYSQAVAQSNPNLHFKVD